MAGFALGSFAGGIGQGIEQGQRIRENYEARLKEKIQKGADTAVENYLKATPDAPGAAPGPPPAPVGPVGLPPPAGGLGAMPGATPMPPPPGMVPPPGPPGGGPPPGPAPMQGGPPGPAGAMPGVPPPSPMAIPGARPMGPPPSPQAAVPPPGGPPPGGPPPGGAPGGAPPGQPPAPQDPLSQAQARAKTYFTSIAQGMKAANPGHKWQPGEFLAAMKEYVSLSNALTPEEKALAQAQLGILNLAVKQQNADTGAKRADTGAANEASEEGYRAGSVDARNRATDTRSADSRYAAQMTYKGRKYAADVGAQSRESVADVGAQSRESVANIGAQSRENVANIGAQSREAVAQQRAAAGGLSGDIKLEAALEKTEIGKTFKRMDTAVNEINDVAGQPDIESNAEAQLGLINRYLYMTTGSTRPPLAEYKKILGAADGQDVYDMTAGLVAAHPILGSDQIRNIVGSANTLANGARARAMKDPLTSHILRKIEGDMSAPDAGGSGGRGGAGGAGGAGAQMSPQDTQASLANARAAIKKSPAHRAEILKRLTDAGIPTQGL